MFRHSRPLVPLTSWSTGCLLACTGLPSFAPWISIIWTILNLSESKKSSSYGWEGPAGANRSLVLDRCHCALSAPIESVRQLKLALELWQISATGISVFRTLNPFLRRVEGTKIYLSGVDCSSKTLLTPRVRIKILSLNSCGERSAKAFNLNSVLPLEFHQAPL